MARPQKFTVDYFSHDANSSQGRTLTILFNNYGHEGISAWWQLLESISSTNNHVICLRNAEDLEYLAARFHFKPERLKEILSKLASLDAIDNELYSKGYIWSQNFVDRLKTVYDSRKQPLPLKPIVSLDNNSVSLDNNSVNLPHNTQTKLKETKLNDTILPTSSREGDKTPSPENVLPSLNEINNLKEPGSNGSKGDLKKGTKQKPADPRITQIFSLIKSYYDFKNEDYRDKMPARDKEAKYISTLLKRHFSPEDVFECWKQKSEAKGCYCEMVYVNQDIEAWINNGKNATEKIYRRNGGKNHEEQYNPFAGR